MQQCQIYHLLGNSIGDVYYVVSESAGYVWIDDNGTERWELLGKTVDTSDFLTKTGLLQTTGTATNNTMSQDAITTELGLKQDTLVSGNNIKTINNNSILGSGNITIQASSSITYVSSETEIGTWIDNKKIYRQIIPITLTGTAMVLADLNVTIDTLINMYGFLENYTSSGGYLDLPINFYNGSNSLHCFLYHKTQIALETNKSQWAGTAYVVVEYTK